MKKFLTLIAVVVVIIFAGLAYVYVNIDNITKNLIEKVGSSQLGVPVKIASLNIDIVQKKAELNGLSIDNPADFSNKEAFRVTDISTRLGKIESQLITIDELKVGDVNVLLELANRTTNLQTIMGNIPKAEQSSSQVQAPDVIIKKVVFGQTTLEPKLTGAAAQAAGDIGKLTVPGFTLTNIGTAENGVSPSEAVRQVMMPYLKKLEKQAIQGQLMERLPAELQDIRGSLKDKTDEVRSNVKDKVQGDVQKKIDDTQKKLDEKIGGALDSVLGGE